MKNKIEDLRNNLFEVMDMLKEGSLTAGDAKAITNAAQTIINSAKVEVDFIKAMGGIGEGTGFIPLEPQRPNMKAIHNNQKNA